MARRSDTEIDLDVSDITVIDGPGAFPTPEFQFVRCTCGGYAIPGDASDLAGMSVVQWPCVRGARWSYCSRAGRITYDVR